MKRITRDRRLTPEEAAKYKAIRKEIEHEKPEIDARIRKRIAAKRKAEASQSGGQTFGQRLRAAREAIGESQVNPAATAGISQGYLSQLETTNESQRFPSRHGLRGHWRCRSMNWHRERSGLLIRNK